MLNIPKDLREFIESLNSNKVRYLITGGYAVAFHGYPRMTGDIDVFVEISEENARKLEKVLTEFGFASLGLSAKDFLEPRTIVQLGYPPNRIDVLTSLSGVGFDEAWRRKVIADVDGLSVWFIGRDDLVVNKAATGRPKDLADLDALSKRELGGLTST
jgi:predicted nucleotidyltransferase